MTKTNQLIVVPNGFRISFFSNGAAKRWPTLLWKEREVLEVIAVNRKQLEESANVCALRWHKGLWRVKFDWNGRLRVVFRVTSMGVEIVRIGYRPMVYVGLPQLPSEALLESTPAWQRVRRPSPTPPSSWGFLVRGLALVNRWAQLHRSQSA